MNTIVKFKRTCSSPNGKMFLCADGSTSSAIEHAAHFYDIQFDSVVAENWIVQPAEALEVSPVTGEPVSTEIAA